ncbi:MAG: hypothetical protein IT458_00060 [Planctomycetes bacterium]|nr:hypothetical protein [Planctomycetota bacterium]
MRLLPGVAALLVPALALRAQEAPAAPGPATRPESAPRTAVLDLVPADDPFAAVVRDALRVAQAPAAIRCARPAEALARLRAEAPRFALVVVRPQDLDVNLAYDLLDVFARIDDDPFVDVAYGVVTGRDAAAARAFLARSDAVRREPSRIPRASLEVMGPNQMDDTAARFWGRPIALPRLAGWRQQSLNHGRRGYPDTRLAELQGYGLVHLGGHGVPERIEQGLTAAQVRRLDWSDAIVWSGACWTGVVGPWVEYRAGRVERRTCAEPFALEVLENGAAAYLAALHPDHGIPVYQEIEHVLATGATLGEALECTYDALVLHAGGRRPELPRWREGAPPPPSGRGNVEFQGTAARILFGDPRIRPCAALVPASFSVRSERDGKVLRITATLRHTELRNGLSDTFAGDLASDPMLFNERMALKVPLAPGDPGQRITVERARSGPGLLRRSRDLPSRVVGHAVEEEDGRRFLHVQVDFPAAGFQESEFRRAGTQVVLRVE